MTPEQLQKLRRFSLVIGVILFSYVVAEFKPIKAEAGGNPIITTPIVRFEIGKPELIPIGLVVASIWGFVGYWYYGYMVNRSPWRRRKELLERSYAVSDEYNYGITDLTFPQVEELKKTIEELFPRFLNRGVRFNEERLGAKKTRHQKSGRSSVEIRERNSLDFRITERQMLGAWFRDFDYAAPLWVNAAALGFWFNPLNRFPKLTVGFSALGLVVFGIYMWSERTSRPSLEEAQDTPNPE